MLTVSVVIACRDDSYLTATLESLAAQRSAPAFEIVVVDGSAHDLKTRLQPWHDRLDLRVIEAGKTVTAGANRNTGVAASRGDGLLFVDADDTVDDDYVRAMADELRSHAVVCSRVEIASLNHWNPSGTHPQQTGPITSEMGFLPFAGAGTLGIHRSLFEEVGGFDPTLPCYEEADLCWRVQLAGREPPAFVGEARLHYRLEPNRRKRWRKAIVLGRTQALLYARYRRAGMPRAPTGEAIANWGALFRDLLLRSVGRSSVNVGWPTGIRLGRILGSVRYRVLYL